MPPKFPFDESGPGPDQITMKPQETHGLMEIDLEPGQPLESLRDQSKRLSQIVSSKTELYNLDPATPDPPQAVTVEKESSGLAYWIREIKSAKEHGGDFKTRNKKAIRAAIGSLSTFSILVFPKQQILGAVWIGNIFMHANIKDGFGESLLSVQQYGRSILLATAISWPVGYFLGMLTTFEASILLPFVVFVLSFLIMTCPQLSARNLMILVMYIIVASNVRDDIEWWEPLGWVATYWIGLAVALLINVFPLPNFALSEIHCQLVRLEKDLTMLLLQCKAYGDNTGTTPVVSRAAIASIEFLHTRIATTTKDLSKKLPGAKVELSWQCKGEAAADLNAWVAQAKNLQGPLKSLKTALVQRVTGEEYSMYSERLREAKAVIAEEIGPARDRMVDAMIAAITVCNAWADPSAHRTVLPDVQGELSLSLRECRQAFHRAMGLAAQCLESNPQTNVPVFAHLTRRMTAFSALFELGDNLLYYLEKHSWEAEEIKGLSQPQGCLSHLCGMGLGIFSYVEQRWLWHNPDTFRLALKTSVGMALASLFVSINYLWNISDPFGVWPGLTIASVNLATTGSSFHKAGDRLFGTLLAAAYALLVTDLFPGNMDAVKIPAITVFTFVMVYLRNTDHAYKYTYAATSIGSMLYGSVKNDFNIAGYIPKRIELIFAGVLLFSMVELLLFPRSSRKMVEGISFQFFLSSRDLFKQAAICTLRMEEYVKNSKQNSEYANGLFNESDDPFRLENLSDCHRKLKKEVDKVKKEMDSAVDEPHIGLSQALQPESFRGLAKSLGDCELQASLLLDALRLLAKYYMKEGHPLREMNWPRIHMEFLRSASEQIEYSCEWIKTAFPDGRLRAQGGNSVKAVTAASSFRGFEDVRLRIISSWSDNFEQFILNKGFEGSDPIALMTLGITTTHILELCRHLQKAGKHVENISHYFPTSK